MNQSCFSLHSTAFRGDLCLGVNAAGGAVSIRPACVAGGAMGLRKRFGAPH